MIVTTISTLIETLIIINLILIVTNIDNQIKIDKINKLSDKIKNNESNKGK